MNPNEANCARDSAANSCMSKLEDVVGNIEQVAERVGSRLGPYMRSEQPSATKVTDQIDNVIPPYFDTLRSLTRRIERASNEIDFYLSRSEL